MPVLAETLNYLKTRRSVTLPFLAEPGPSADELRQILEIGVRVPDHGKLAPWRLITYSADDWVKIGERLIGLQKARNPEMSEAEAEAERTRFLPVPLTIGVISTAAPHPKIPEYEQFLSAGCVAFNLCHAAACFGFGAHWVTRWFATDVEAAAILGAGEGERFVGFVHIGTPTARLEDRERPDINKVVTAWKD